MADSKQFGRSLDGFSVDVRNILTAVNIEAAKTTRRRVAERTPKKTGRAAASWNLNVNVPNDEVAPENFNNPSGAVDAGKINVSGATLGSILYVSNNIHYIGRLNAGSSQQAPSGFVQATALEIELALPFIVAAVKARFS